MLKLRFKESKKITGKWSVQHSIYSARFDGKSNIKIDKNYGQN